MGGHQLHCHQIDSFSVKGPPCKVANLAVAGQLSTGKYVPPFSPLKCYKIQPHNSLTIWSREETGSAVPSRISPLILHALYFIQAIQAIQAQSCTMYRGYYRCAGVRITQIQYTNPSSLTGSKLVKSYN